MRIRLIATLIAMTAVPAFGQDKSPERAAMNRLKGQPTAAVTVYEIADFQCPYCARFAREIFPRIDSAFVKTGKVRWIFVNFPLPTHSHAWIAAEAAMCAGGISDRFWPVHDRLFDEQEAWSNSTNPAPLFRKYAKEAGVDEAGYDACIADDRMATLIVRDLLNASGANPTGTPAFVVDNQPIFAGLKPFEEWKEMLEAALRRNAASSK